MSDLDKTIEELEAEVTAELEEAADAPKKGAVAASEKGDKVEGDVEDLGAPVVKGDEKKGPDAAKKIKKDTSIPTAVKGDEAPQKLKEEDEEDDEEDKSDDSDKEEMDEKEDAPEIIKAQYKTKAEEKARNVAEMMKGMNAAEDAKKYAESQCGSHREQKESLDIDSVDVSDDVKALVEGEDLSEEFQTKAATIFEAAVKSKLRGEVERLEMENTQTVAEEIEAFKKELTEKVDSYLDYVVKEWMQENELAIDRGLKGEIAEDFITGLKALFEEHYIDVPDEKYDVLEGQASKD